MHPPERRPKRRSRPPAARPPFHLRLYIAGQTPRSLRAIDNLQRLREDHLPGKCRVEVIDLMQEPDRAKDDDVVVVPTLVRCWPAPARKVIGDLSDTPAVLAGLQVALVSNGVTP